MFRALARLNRLFGINLALILCAAMGVGALVLFGLSGGVAQVRGAIERPAQTDGVLTNTVYLPVMYKPVPVYYDGFDDPNSGWYVGAALRYNDWCRWDVGCHEGLEEVAYMSYYDSNYRFYIPLTWHFGGDVDTWFVWPVETAPLDPAYYPLPQNYCIEARGRFSNKLAEDYQPWWAHWGIVFGTNDSLSEVYTFQVNANHDSAVLQYHNYTYPGNRQPLSGEEVNVEIPLAGWSHGDMASLLPTHEYNTLKVAVQGDTVLVYANGKLLNIVSVPNMPRAHVGLIGGSWEVTPVQIDVSDFRYDPYCNQ